MKSGDFIQTPAGHQWTIAFVASPARLPGRHVFVLRAVDDGEREEVLYALMSEAEAQPLWVGDTEIDERDVFEVEGNFRIVHRQSGLMISLRDDDGKLSVSWRWRIAMAMLRGRDIGPDAIWRAALPGEV